MMIRGLLFLLFLYTLLVWIVAVYLGGEEMIQRGLFWTGVGVAGLMLWLILERVIGFWKVRRARTASAPAAAAPTLKSDKPVHPDDEALRQLVHEANLQLEKAEAYKGSRTTIFDLPMYLILGSENSGKTSVLQNSGLEAVLLAGQASAGGAALVPTRIANIWLAKDTVYVELSGRVFSGDATRFAEFITELRPEQPGKGGKFASSWLGKLLYPQKRPSNLRGVMLVSDLKDFLGTPEMSKLDRAAALVRARLDAVGAHFGLNTPVYLLFNRAESIPFYRDFFARLSESESGQMFGMVTPREAQTGSGEVWAEAETKRLNRFFNQIFLKLSDRRLLALTVEPQVSSRPAIYEFPREFKRIRTPLVQYIVDIFRPNPLQGTPELRGFFFAGTRAVERTSQPAARSSETIIFGGGDAGATQIFSAGATGIFNPGKLQHQGGSSIATGWMFLTDLFHKVIPQDRPAMVVLKPQASGVNPRMVNAALTAAFAAGLGIILIWGISWLGNRSLVADTTELVENMNRRPAALTVENLKPVDAVRRKLEQIAADDSWSLHWGLYTGDDVHEAAQAAYFGRLRAMFLDGANTKLGAGLLASSIPSGDSLYDRVKAHVTIADKSCAVDAGLVTRVMDHAVADWQPNLEPDARALVRSQLDYYAARLAEDGPAPVKLSRNDGAVSTAQALLLNDGGMEPQLNAILADVAKQAPPLKVAERIPDYAKVLSGPAQIPGEFTKRGAELASAIIEGGNWGSAGESCVTGSNAVAATVQSAQSKNQLRDLYFLRYAQAWRAFLNGVSVLPYGNIRDAATKLQILGGSQSPLLAVVKIVAENTQFPERAGEVSRWEAIETTAQGVGLGSLVDRFKKAQKGAEQVQAAVQGPAGLNASDVTKLFQPVQMTTPPAMPVLVSEGNQPYVGGLRGLQQNLDALSRAAEAEKPTLIPQAQQALAAAKAGLQTLADKFADTGNQGLNGELSQLLNQPIQLADNIIPRNAVTLTAGKQNADLAQMCSAIRPVLQKYPFNPQAGDSNVAAPADISRLFAPTVGLVWQYQQKSLADMVAKQGSAWVADPKAKVTPALIAFLTASQQLSDIFFGGTNLIQPRVRFTLRAGGQNRVKLVLDGKELNPALQTEFQWPGAGAPGAEGYVYIGDTPVPFAKYSGMWGVFRLFQNAEDRALGERNVRWTQIRGAGNAEAQKLPVPAVVQFVGEMPGGADLFNPKFFDALRCPGRAVDTQ